MNPQFDPDYRARILSISFLEPTVISKTSDILKLRSSWTNALKTWHSPYKALINSENLSICLPETVEEQQKFIRAWETFITFLKGFHLQRIASYGSNEEQIPKLPFPQFETFEEACAHIGVRDFTKVTRKSGDLRSSIILDNQFRQHTVELSFAEHCTIANKSQLMVLKSKMTNNLMQWHSKWNLLINCENLTLDESIHQEFEQMIRFFKGFFLANMIGYQPHSKEDKYPFKVFRSRHKAASELTQVGQIAAEEANCASRKTSKASSH